MGASGGDYPPAAPPLAHNDEGDVEDPLSRQATLTTIVTQVKTRLGVP
jgi:hypothetical protein